MNLFPNLKKKYTKDSKSALEAQRLAHEIAFAPMVFQVSRLMLKFGIFALLDENNDGLTQHEIAVRAHLSDYAAQVLLEASLSIGTVIVDDDKYRLTKAGWFLLNDKVVQANLDFNHDVNYLGLFRLDEALKNRQTCWFESLWRLADHLRRTFEPARTGAEKLVRVRPFLF